MATQVSNFTELKTAIEDITTTEIIATSNITFSGGIKINVSKPSIVIDMGNYTITDNNSSSFTDTIYIPSTTSTVSVTVKNAIWSGRNYYGVVGVYNGNTNCTIILDNITYTGPQFVYNKSGITQISNCTVTLSKNDSSTNPQEFCEANRLSISGNVKVTSQSTSDAVIWFTNANSYLTVEENANFEVTAAFTYLLYTDSQPVLTFKKGSYTTISTKTGLFYASSSTSHIASSITIEDNASFIAFKNDSNSVPMMKCISNLTVGHNATLNLYSVTSNSAALIYFSQQANIVLNNPKSFVLYNNAGTLFSFQTGSSSSSNKLNVTAEMMSIWTYAKIPYTNAGNINDTPTKTFNKENYSTNLTLTATMTSSSMLSVESNIDTNDTGYPLSTTTFNLFNNKVLAIGNVFLDVNDITDNSTSIAGETEPNSTFSITYSGNNLSGTSNESGIFDIEAMNPFVVDDVVSIHCNNNFLNKKINMTVLGSLTIQNIYPLQFYSFVTKPNLSIVPRVDNNWSIEILDTRSSGDNWYLYAYIQKPLESGDNSLENAIVFKQNNDMKILSTTPTLIYTGTFTEQNKTTSISWNGDEGLLLSLNPSLSYNSGDYSTTLFWEITTTEL